MDNIKRFETVSDYNIFNNNETLHPLVSVVDLSKAYPRQASNMYFGFYTIFLKEVKCGDLRYGRATYDYQEGTLVFIAPGQVISVEITGETYQPKGYALIFHPDLIHGTALGKHIADYTFSVTSRTKRCTYQRRKEGLYWMLSPRLNMSCHMPLTSTAKN
jgi:AraC family transcriptional regulator, transcriptional activator of pobA